LDLAGRSQRQRQHLTIWSGCFACADQSGSTQSFLAPAPVCASPLPFHEFEVLRRSKGLCGKLAMGLAKNEFLGIRTCHPENFRMSSYSILLLPRVSNEEPGFLPPKFSGQKKVRYLNHDWFTTYIQTKPEGSSHEEREETLTACFSNTPKR
jgi:hypothetical protein